MDDKEAMHTLTLPLKYVDLEDDSVMLLQPLLVLIEHFQYMNKDWQETHSCEEGLSLLVPGLFSGVFGLVSN